MLENVEGAVPLVGTLTTETITETVEFRSGSANTSKRVATVDSVNWLTPSLGAILVSPYTSDLTVNSDYQDGHGVAVVTYTTMYYSYPVSGYGYHQFIARET